MRNIPWPLRFVAVLVWEGKALLRDLLVWLFATAPTISCRLVREGEALLAGEDWVCMHACTFDEEDGLLKNDVYCLSG